MQAEKLIRDIEKAKRRWDERSQFEISGVGNLSVSDLDTLQLYAETYLKHGNLETLMKPLGSILKVLEAYGYKAG